MSKNRNSRNAKVIRKLLITTIPFDASRMVAGQVYKYQNGWLFCMRTDGTLGTDCGAGLELLKSHHSLLTDNHTHWCSEGCVISALPGVKLPV